MTCTHVVQYECAVRSTAVAPDGHLLAVGLESGVVQLLDARTGERRTALGGGIWGEAHSLAFSPASSASPLLLLAVGFSDNTSRVWDCSSGVCMAKLQGHRDFVRCVAFSPDGRLLASASDDKTVRLWRTDDWHVPPAVLRGHEYYVFGVSFSCDGRLLASCSWDRTVRLWHILDSGTAAATAAAPAAAAVAAAAVPAPAPAPATIATVFEAGQMLHCAAFSPVDSRLLACGGQRGYLVLARAGADDGAIVVERKLQGHTSSVSKMIFFPCGRKLASTSWDRTVRLWSVASGACLRVLRGHTEEVRAIAFFPNGKQLASGSSDKTVRIFTVCAWSDQTHHLYGAPLKAAVFILMCVRARLEQGQDNQYVQLPRLPMEMWLLVFGQLQLALGADRMSRTSS